MSTPSIKQLRQSGWKVRVMHRRNHSVKRTIDGEYPELSNFGGSTTVEITTPDMSITASGKAVCSLKENFNRRVGNSIALGRALELIRIQQNMLSVANSI
jgi:hypothetical protein